MQWSKMHLYEDITLSGRTCSIQLYRVPENSPKISIFGLGFSLLFAISFAIFWWYFHSITQKMKKTHVLVAFNLFLIPVSNTNNLSHSLKISFHFTSIWFSFATYVMYVLPLHCQPCTQYWIVQTFLFGHAVCR